MCSSLSVWDEDWTVALHQSHFSLQHPCFLQAKALQVNRSCRAGWSLSTELISALGAFLHLQPRALLHPQNWLLSWQKYISKETYPQLVSQLQSCFTSARAYFFPPGVSNVKIRRRMLHGTGITLPCGNIQNYHHILSWAGNGCSLSSTVQPQAAMWGVFQIHCP